MTMNAHTPRILTDGETALVNAFETRFGANLSAANRLAAIGLIKDKGLPTRRVEAFHYTDLRALIQGGWTVADRPDEESAQAIGAAFPRLVSDAAVLHFCNGHHFDRGEDMPDGISVRQAMPELDTPSTNGEIVEAINLAFADAGASLEVAANSNIQRTVGIVHAHTGEADTLAAVRNSIRAGAKSTSRFIDRAIGPDDARYLHSSVVQLKLEEGATVDYVLSIEEGDAAQRLARLNVELATDATLNLFILNAGGKLVRQEICFDVVGEGSSLNISGVNLIGGEAHVDVTSIITHHVPNTDASETFRNVATGRGRGVFQGQINVRQPAQLTDARMACNTLLLSDECDFSAKPELEIFADDVQCAHGATVTDLEDSYMFYLMARGIPEIQARRLLIKAFVAEIVEEMEDEGLIEALEARIDVWMERHV